MDLLDVLLHVAALAERFAAARNRAFEWLVLCVGTHVVNKFRSVRHNAMAVPILALEEPLPDLVALKAREAKDGVLVGAW